MALFGGFFLVIDVIGKAPMNYIQPRSLQFELFFGAIWSSRLLSYENMAYRDRSLFLVQWGTEEKLGALNF